MDIKEWHEKNLYASIKPKAFPYRTGDTVRIRNDIGGKRKGYAGRRATITATVVLVPTFPGMTVYRLDIDCGRALWTEGELEPIGSAEGG